jgi:hypothetical protein
MFTTSCSVTHTIELYNNGQYSNSICQAICTWEDKNDEGNFQPDSDYTFQFSGINTFTGKTPHIGYDNGDSTYTLNASITCYNSDVQTNPSDYFTISENNGSTMVIHAKKSTAGEKVYIS